MTRFFCVMLCHPRQTECLGEWNVNQFRLFTKKCECSMKNNLRNFRFIYISNVTNSIWYIKRYKSIKVWFVLKHTKMHFSSIAVIQTIDVLFISSNVHFVLKRKLLDQYYPCKPLWKCIFIYKKFSENL